MEQLSFDDLEEWRSVPSYEGLYEVSRHGQVKSFHRKTPRILRPAADKDKGYLRVALCRDGDQQTRTVHGLVAEAFLGSRPDGLEVRHLDGNPANCAVTNLCYGTPSENNFDRVRHGTHPNASKDECADGHEYTEENTIVVRRKDGTVKQRVCRQCTATWKTQREKERASGESGEPCSAEGCDRGAIAKGLCRKDYLRQYRQRKREEAA